MTTTWFGGNVDLESVSSSISNLVQATALVVGGGWAYLKFVRGRTFRSRARLEVTADRYHYGADPALLVHVSMHNEGLSKIDLSAPYEKFVRVDAIFPDAWLPDVNIDWGEDQARVSQTLLFQPHAWIEPNETIEDHLLIPVSAAQRPTPIAYRVRARVTQPPSRRIRREQTGQTWTADLILPMALTPERRQPDAGAKEGEGRHATSTAER